MDNTCNAILVVFYGNYSYYVCVNKDGDDVVSLQ